MAAQAVLRQRRRVVSVRALVSVFAVELVVVGVVASSGGAMARDGGSAILGSYVVVLKPSADRAALVAQARGAGGDVFMQYSHALNGFAVQIPAAAVNGLSHNPNVEFIEPDGEVTAAAAPTVCPIDTTSGFPAQCVPPDAVRIGAEQSSARSGDGRGSVNVNVAVIDSGIDGTHPDLHVVGGTTCTNDGLPPTEDPGNHGTFVAGIIGASDNGFGVVGLAPGANLYSVRALNKQLSATYSRVICGIDWVTGTRTDSDPSNDITVANMSLGGKGSDDGNCGRTNKDAIHLAICTSVAAGVTYITSAGNSSIDIQTQIPAAYDEVLTATAMSDFDGKPGGLYSGTECGETDDTVASFSNFATLVADQAHTVAAPGGCDISTYPVGALPGTDYAVWSGTSFAAPHVTGTVALCITDGACAGLTPTQIVTKIVSDAATYNAKSPTYGYQGDPLRPVSGKYYGYLISASGY